MNLQVELETSNEVSKETDRKVFVNLQTGKKLGCGIGTGQNNEPGIFILTITNGSLAQKMGLQVKCNYCLILLEYMFMYEWC